MRELHLFAGIGGGILGGELLGHEPVCAVELDPFCRALLAERWPGLAIHDDIRTFNGAEWRSRVDIVCGGFPCQDISSAGKRAGLEGDRSSLWWEMHRVICEVGPRFVFVENVAALAIRGLDRVLGSLADLGFDAEWCVLSAAEVGAPHLRKRLWILAAKPDGERLQERALHDRRDIEAASSVAVGPCAPVADAGSPTGGREEGHAVAGAGREETRVGEAESGRCRGDVADADGECRPPRAMHAIEGSRWRDPHGSGGEKPVADAGGAGLPPSKREELRGEGWRRERRAVAERGWWGAEPDVGRVAHGIPARVDRLRGLGNAQVPLQAATAFRILMRRLSEAVA